eukprot:m.34347 g.34347  ORF g.34347 m.34347 type:complete len:756 (+) comp6524_c0_seq1:36-2303(+)
MSGVKDIVDNADAQNDKGGFISILRDEDEKEEDLEKLDMEDEDRDSKEEIDGNNNEALSGHDLEVMTLLEKMDEEWNEYQQEIQDREEEATNNRSINFEMVLRRNVFINGTSTVEAETDRIANTIFNLKRVRLDGEGIHHIDNLECLGPYVSSLFLNNNFIRRMENLDALLHLKSLVLANNEISEWSNISYLKELLLLDLSNNQLPILPSKELLPTSLTMLYLRGNPCAHSFQYSKSNILTIVPNLKILDGTNIDQLEGSNTIEEGGKRFEMSGNEEDIRGLKADTEDEQPKAHPVDKRAAFFKSSLVSSTTKKREEGGRQRRISSTSTSTTTSTPDPKIAKQHPQPPTGKQKQRGGNVGYAQQRLERLKQIAAAKKKEISSISKDQRAKLTHGVAQVKRVEKKTKKENEDDAEDATMEHSEIHEALKECILGNKFDSNVLSDRVLANLRRTRSEMKLHSETRRKQLVEDFNERIEEIKQYRQDHSTLFFMSQMDQTTSSSRPMTASSLRANRCEQVIKDMEREENSVGEVKRMVEETALFAQKAAEDNNTKAMSDKVASNKYSISVQKDSRPTTALSRFNKKMEQRSVVRASKDRSVSMHQYDTIDKDEEGEKSEVNRLVLQDEVDPITIDSKTKDAELEMFSISELDHEDVVSQSRPETSSYIHRTILPDIDSLSISTTPNTITATGKGEMKIDSSQSATSARENANSADMKQRTSSAGKKPRKLGSAQRKPTSVRLKPLDKKKGKESSNTST